MKRINLIIVLLCAVVQFAHGTTPLGFPFFSPVRDEILNQQMIASNAPIHDSRLMASLAIALVTIDRTKSNYLSGATSLRILAKNLNRTSVSNVFAPILRETKGEYVDVLLREERSLSDRLDKVFPSRVETNAEQNLERLRAALSSAQATNDVIAAAKVLAVAAQKLVVAGNLATQAERVAPSGFYFTATTDPGDEFSSSIGGRLAGVFGFFNGFLTLAAIDPTPLNPQRDIVIAALLPANTDVPFSVDLGDMRSSNAQYRIGETAEVWRTANDGTGTLTITEFNQVQRIIGGTFSFNAPADSDTAASGTVVVSNGKFRVKYRLLGP